MSGLHARISCPIRDEKTGACMCLCDPCDHVDNHSCFGVRSAFNYGKMVAENRCITMIKEMRDEINDKVNKFEEAL